MPARPFEVGSALARLQPATATVDLHVGDAYGNRSFYKKRTNVNPGGEVILRFDVPGIASGRTTLIAEIENDGHDQHCHGDIVAA